MIWYLLAALQAVGWGLLALFRRGPPGIVRCTISKKSQDAMENRREGKGKRKQEKKGQA
jgi:hypothetical protein